MADIVQVLRHRASIASDGMFEGPRVYTEAADEIELLRGESTDLLTALELIFPLAKGYAAVNRVGSNARYVEAAEAAISKARGLSPVGTQNSNAASESGESRPAYAASRREGRDSDGSPNRDTENGNG